MRAPKAWFPCFERQGERCVQLRAEAAARGGRSRSRLLELCLVSEGRRLLGCRRVVSIGCVLCGAPAAGCCVCCAICLQPAARLLAVVGLPAPRCRPRRAERSPDTASCCRARGTDGSSAPPPRGPVPSRVLRLCCSLGLDPARVGRCESCAWCADTPVTRDSQPHCWKLERFTPQGSWRAFCGWGCLCASARDTGKGVLALALCSTRLPSVLCRWQHLPCAQGSWGCCQPSLTSLFGSSEMAVAELNNYKRVI